MARIRGPRGLLRSGVLLAVAFLAAAAGCAPSDGGDVGGDGGAPPDDGRRIGGVAADVVEIQITGFAFSLEEITIRPGTRIRWVNRSHVAHSTTADGKEWDSDLLEPGETYERAFLTEGRFPYHCVPHPFMRAVIVVARG